MWARYMYLWSINIIDVWGVTTVNVPFHKSFKNHSQFFYFFTTVSSHFPGIVILNKGQQPFSYKLFFFILPGLMTRPSFFIG